MALPFLISPTYSGSGILAKSCVICYVHRKSGGSKSYEIQTISAKIGLTSGLFELARPLEVGLLFEVFVN